MIKKKKKNNLLDYNRKIRLSIVVGTIYLTHLFFNTLLIPLKVNSTSMEPNINQGSHLFYSPLAMPDSSIPIKIARGTVLVLKSPYHANPSQTLSWLNTLYRFITLNIGDLNRREKLGKNPYIVRRVVGIPGDTIYMANKIAQIQPGGAKEEGFFTSEFELIKKHYVILTEDQKTRDWPKNLPLQGNTEKVTLREDEYFVLADNRDVGNDSSYWGPIYVDKIRGRVLFQYLKKQYTPKENK